MKTLLFKPFEKYRENTLLLVGILITLGGSFLGDLLHIRFDGVLDVHVVPDSTLYQPFIDNVINIFCLTLFLYIASKYINKKTRLIDILVVAIVARLPLYLLSLFNINNILHTSTLTLLKTSKSAAIHNIDILSLTFLLLFAIITLLVLVWYIALLFNGSKVASNGKGQKFIIVFVIALLFAEILSKILIYQFN